VRKAVLLDGLFFILGCIFVVDRKTDAIPRTGNFIQQSPRSGSTEQRIVLYSE